MDREHAHWLMELAHKHQEHVIGAVTTVLVLLAAYSTLKGHVAHTQEVKAQALAVDQWGFYQAKHIRAHMYAIEADKAWAAQNGVLARRYLAKAIYEQCGDPVSPVCKLETCADPRPEAAAKCAIPVLKDSPELQVFYRTAYAQPKLVTPVEAPTSASAAKARPVSEAGREKLANTSEESKSRNPGAVELIGKSQDKERAVQQYERIAEAFDDSEILLEIALMLCGVALVIGTRTYWRFSYVILFVAVSVAVPGVAYGAWGWLLSHAHHV